MTTDISVCRNQNQVISSFMTCHPLYIKINTMGATCGAGNAYPYGAPEFTLDFFVRLVLSDLLLSV